MKFLLAVVVIHAACGNSTSNSVTPTASPLVRAVGASVASPGRLFAGLELGAPDDARARDIQTRWDAEQAKSGIRVTYKAQDGTIRALRVNTVTTDAAGCRELRATLDKTWSAGATVGDSTIWLDPTKQHRAGTTERDDWCSLQIERYLTPGQLVPSSLLDLLGKPSQVAKTTYGATPPASWSTDGLGPLGGGINNISGVVDGDTIVGLTAGGFVGSGEVDALRTHLDTLLGESTVVAGVAGRGYRWAKSPTATLTYRNHMFELTIGGLPALTGPGRWTSEGTSWIYRYENRDEVVYGDDARCRYLLKSRCPAGEECPSNPELRLCPPLTADVVPAH